MADLIRKVAKVKNTEPTPGPVEWYTKEYGNVPSYSELLDKLSQSPEVRQGLLEGYFSPSDDEREEGLKLPTETHHAIARLVKNGFVKVIVTTNFDRLLEQALRDEGVDPVVVSTEEAASGIEPIAHLSCTIIKVNGDYQDTNLRNTPDELAEYGPAMTKLLNRVFDEFGLIVCGWSGEYDEGLRKCLLARTSRRYGSYWCHRGDIEESGQQIVDQQGFEKVEITSSDEFFQELADKVDALARYESGPHPLSAQVAVDTTKRLLEKQNVPIRLHDMLHDEISQTIETVTSDEFPLNADIDRERFRERCSRYEALSEVPVSIIATATFWSEGRVDDMIMQGLQRLANIRKEVSTRKVAYDDLLRYPGLLGLYAAGISALSRERYELAQQFMYEIEVGRLGREEFALRNLSPMKVFSHSSSLLEETEGKKTRAPASKYLKQVLWPIVQPLIPSYEEYDMLFDEFEALLALELAHWSQKGQGGSSRIWPGEFLYHRHGNAGTMFNILSKRLEDLGSNWPPIEAGFFDGSASRAKEAFDGTRKYGGRAWTRFGGL